MDSLVKDLFENGENTKAIALRQALLVLKGDFDIRHIENRDAFKIIIETSGVGKIEYINHFAISMYAIFKGEDNCIGEWAGDEFADLKSILMPLIKAYQCGLDNS